MDTSDSKIDYMMTQDTKQLEEGVVSLMTKVKSLLSSRPDAYLRFKQTIAYAAQ